MNDMRKLMESINRIDEEYTRKDFVMVADLLTKIEDVDARQASAMLYADVFAESNPRFDREKFLAAADVEMPLEEDEYDDTDGPLVPDDMYAQIVADLAKIKPGYQPGAMGKTTDNPNEVSVMAWNPKTDDEEDMIFNTDTMSFEGSDDNFMLDNPFESINESYHSRLAAAAEDIAHYNKRMPNDELIELIRTQLGDMAAQYMSDKLAGGETDWKENLRKTLDNMDKPNYSWSNRTDNIEEAEEDKNLGPYEDNYEQWLGQTVKITGGEHRGETGKVIDANWERNETGSREGVYQIKLYSGGVITLYLSEWSHDQIELAYDPTHRPDGKYDPEIEEGNRPGHEHYQSFGLGSKVKDTRTDAQKVKDEKRFKKTMSTRKKAYRTEEVDEGVADWMKRLDNKAASWINDKSAVYSAKQAHEFVTDVGVRDASKIMSMSAREKGVAAINALERYLEIQPDGEYAESVRYLLPAVEREQQSWDALMKQADRDVFGIEEGSFRHEEDPISVQVKSLLAQGKKVMSKIGGAMGEVTRTDGRLLYIKYPGRREGVTSFDSKDNVSIRGELDHYDIIATNNDINEARGRVVEVPPELRGSSEMTGDATSEDARKFLADLGPDDDVSHDVVDPETGELLDWPTAGLDHNNDTDWRVAGGTKRERGKTEWEKKQARMDDVNSWVPDLYYNGDSSFGDAQDSAWEFINELRDSDFYNVVWREVGGVDMDTGDEDAFQDYDTEYEVPVLIKRKDGNKFTDDDHDNMREVVKAVKAGSTMQNTGVSYVGLTDGGTTARFVPSFM